MWETIRGYLTFTRKERFGVLFLLVLISILFILPYFFKPSVGDPDPAVYEKMKAGIRKFESREADSLHESANHPRYTKQSGETSSDYSANSNKPMLPGLFYFDPNRNNANDWERLGLNEHLSQTIIHYIEKGGRFRKAEDLQKIYGLQPADYKRLLPFVRIPREKEAFKTGSGYYANSAYNLHTVKKADSFFRQSRLKMNAGRSFAYMAKKFIITDINQADSSDWSMLPGIGEKLASRIIRFREKLGGFYQVDQVGETFGLADSIFQSIKPFLRGNGVSLHQIDLNSATKEELQAHPYIRWQIARSISDYRQQHGNFHSVDELLQLVRMDQEKFDKLKPYLVVKP